MEEKRKSTKKKSLLNNRSSKIQTKTQLQQLITNGNGIKKDNACKPVEKVLKRIGRVNPVKAFKQNIDENYQNKENKVNKVNENQQKAIHKQEKPNIIKKQEPHAVHKQQTSKSSIKPLKRIGKKPMVTAYIHSTSQHQKTVQLQKNQEQPIIKINNMLYEKVMDCLNFKNEEKNTNNNGNEVSVLLQQQITHKEIDILDEPIDQEKQTEILSLNKVNSNDESNCVDNQSFNIKINKALSENENDILSDVEKSGQGTDILNKSDSENAVYSDIVEGDLNKLVNQSFQNSQSTNAKIQDLLSQIQKDCNKKNNGQKKGQKQERQSANFLSVPKKQRHSKKNNFAKEEKTKAQSFSQICKNNTQILKDLAQQKEENEKYVENKKQKMSQEPQKIQQTGKQKRKKSLIRVNRKSSKKFKIEEKKASLTEMQMQKLTDSIIHGQKEKFVDAKIPKQPTQINRLLASDKPKRTFRSIIAQQRMSLLGGMKPRESSISSLKLSQSQVLLNKVPVKTPNINQSKSLHQNPGESQVPLKKQSLANRFKPRQSQIPTIKSNDSKAALTKKRNQKQFEVNQCVIEARKIIKND